MKNRFYKLGIPTLAAALVGLILLLNAMAACPALHELIHKDAEHADHQCAVTMFAHGKVESATTDVPIIAATVPIEAILQIELPVFSSVIQNLPLGRAPPVITSPLV